MSRRLRIGTVMAAGCFAFALGAAPALALNSRSAVALEGSDSAACTVGAPCRTLVQALTQTTPGGEILVKDSAGFGPITITQAVTINAPPGVIGFITATSGDAITVNAGLSDTVIVTGLYLDGQNTGSNGVTVNTAGSFSIGGSTITGFTGSPINYVNSTATNQKLTISNSSFYSNGTPLSIKPTAGTSVFSSIRGLALSGPGIVVDNTSAINTKIGLLFDNSILRYDGGTGISIISAGTNCPGASCVFVQANMDKSEMFNTNVGLSTSGAGASIYASESAFVNISTLCATTGGSVNSFRNNMVVVGTIGCTLTTATLQ